MPKLTKRVVDAIEPGTTEKLVWDEELHGFGLRVRPSGRKTYLVMTRVKGRLRKITLGTHGTTTAAQARVEALQIISQAKAVSSSDEFSLIVGIENSLVGARARTAGTRPGSPSVRSISHHSLEADSKGSGDGGPAWRTLDDLGSTPTGTFDHGDRPAHRARPEDGPQIH